MSVSFEVFYYIEIASLILKVGKKKICIFFFFAVFFFWNKINYSFCIILTFYFYLNFWTHAVN